MLNIDTQKMHRLRDALMQVNDVIGGNSDAIESLNTTADAQALLQRFEPFAETLYLAMLSDGQVDDEELYALHAALRLLSNGGLSLSMIDDMLQRFAKNLQSDGREYRLRLIGAHLCATQSDREIAFKLAATVVLANHRIEAEEHNFLVTLTEYYGISAKRSQFLLGEV